MATIQENINRIKDAKEDLRGAINDKGGSLAEDAKLEEFAEAVENLPSGGSDTAVDFGSSYSEAPESIAQQLKEDLEFTAEVERGIESGEYIPQQLINGMQKVTFKGREYIFKDRIAFLPKNIGSISDFFNFKRLKEFLGEFRINSTVKHFRSCGELRVVGRNYSITTTGSIAYSFTYCFSLISISVDFTNLTNSLSAFEQCFSLRDVEMLGWGATNLSLHHSSRLTPLSVHNIITAGCKTYEELVASGKEGGIRELKLHSTALNNWKNSEYYEEDSAMASTHEITVK